MDIDMVTLFLGIIFTGLAYEILPLFSRFILKEKFSLKEAKKLAISNSLLVYIIFSLLHIFVIKDYQLANIAPAFIWGYISYFILEPQKEHSNLNKEHIKEDKKVNNINYNIENKNEEEHILQLERLSILYKDGYLTEDEFNKEKQKILNR